MGKTTLWRVCVKKKFFWFDFYLFLSSSLFLINLNDVVLFHLQLQNKENHSVIFKVMHENNFKHRNCSIHLTCFGVSSSLIRRPSKRNRKLDTGTPTRSEYDFFNFPIWVVILTRKWISFESWPTTFNLIYSVSPPASFWNFKKEQNWKKTHEVWEYENVLFSQNCCKKWTKQTVLTSPILCVREFQWSRTKMWDFL